MCQLRYNAGSKHQWIQFCGKMLESILDVLSVFFIVGGLVVGQEVRYPVGSNPGVIQAPPGQHRNPAAVADAPTNQQGNLYLPAPGEHVVHVPGDYPQGGNAHSHSYDAHYPSYVHNVPPAPEPSASSYIATLSYGEGYPTIVYHCSLTDHKPVATTTVHGPNGHLCTVSYYKTPSYALAPPQTDAHYHQHNKGPFTTLLDMILPSYEKKSAGEGNPVDHFGPL